MSRAMKDSGIPWIGEIPEGWHICQVKNIFTIARGRVIPITEMDDSYHYPVYSSQTKDNGCMGYIPTFDYEGEALTWTTDGANAGTVFYRVGKFNCTNICGVLQLKTRTSFITYMLYSVGHSAFHCRRADTNGYKIMSNEMAEIKIAVPPLAEQQAIAEFLDRKCAEVDEMIALQEQIIEELKAYKQSVITEAVTKGLNPDVPMKDSGIEWIGQIPEHWEVSKLNYFVSKIGSGSTPTGGSEVYTNSGVKFLRSQNVYFDGFKLDEIVYITDKIDESMKGTRVLEGDVLLNITGGSIGRCYFVDSSLGRANVNQHVSIIRPKNKTNTKYLKYFLQSEVGQIQIQMLQTGGNREGLSAAALKEFRFLSLPLSEQRAIADYLDEKCADIDSLIQTKLSKIDSLKEYKKSIIYEYVTGKRKVE